MPRTLKIAAVQMDATPAVTVERLSRAADLITEAASVGAQLVVLPEVFNTGYEYHDRNYGLAESADGQTVTWMRSQAAQHQIHLAGTLLLKDGDEIYNAALLFSPDGKMWRYDKNYPYGWERAYFREGQGITIADTDLGKLGMMICWDSAHADLWKRYAGEVDAMVIMSCPPAYNQLDLVFPDGERLKTQTGSREAVFGTDMDKAAAWLRVPVVNTSGGGMFRSKVPAPYLSVAASLIFQPKLWSKFKDAPEIMLEAGYFQQTKVIDSGGKVLSRVETSGDGYTLAEVQLADSPPHPADSPLPRVGIPAPLLFLLDYVITALMIRLYREGTRRQWGARMSPRDSRTVVWGGVVILALLVGWLLGRALG